MVSTPLKNISQIGSFPQVGVKIKNVWNHHLDKNLMIGIWNRAFFLTIGMQISVFMIHFFGGPIIRMTWREENKREKGNRNKQALLKSPEKLLRKPTSSFFVQLPNLRSNKQDPTSTLESYKGLLEFNLQISPAKDTTGYVDAYLQVQATQLDMLPECWQDVKAYRRKLVDNL